MKRTNICIIGVAEGEEREKGAENISEDVIAENFPNLVKYTEIQVQEAQRAPNRINPKRKIIQFKSGQRISIDISPKKIDK